jgi:hypothetical protein
MTLRISLTALFKYSGIPAPAVEEPRKQFRRAARARAPGGCYVRKASAWGMFILEA